MKPVKIPLQYKVQNGLYVRVMDAVGYNTVRHVEVDVWGWVEDIESSIIIYVKGNIHHATH